MITADLCRESGGRPATGLPEPGKVRRRV